jgi:hypothetical protein
LERGMKALAQFHFLIHVEKSLFYP